jgi:hypothetical protein
MITKEACIEQDEFVFPNSSDFKEPEWVIKQTIERRRRELAEKDKEYEEKLSKARKREAALKRMAAARVHKRTVGLPLHPHRIRNLLISLFRNLRTCLLKMSLTKSDSCPTMNSLLTILTIISPWRYALSWPSI